MNKFQKTLHQNQIVSEYLNIINSTLGLTNSQLKVLEALLSINSSTPIINGTRNILTKESRQQLVEDTHVDYTTISRYMGVFKDKGLLINSRGWVINPDITPVFDDKSLIITFRLDVNE